MFWDDNRVKFRVKNLGILTIKKLIKFFLTESIKLFVKIFSVFTRMEKNKDEVKNLAKTTKSNNIYCFTFFSIKNLTFFTYLLITSTRLEYNLYLKEQIQTKTKIDMNQL